jgi:putative transposase
VLEGEEQAPRVFTDRRASDPPALRQVLHATEHRRREGPDNRAEHSHGPVRRRERVLQRFKSAEHARLCSEPFRAVGNHDRLRRHLLPAEQDRQPRTDRFRHWREVVGLSPRA